MIFFESWDSILRIFVTLFFIYPGLIILLQMYGKRSLSQLDMFDFIITVALGSIFASVLVFENITVSDGLLVFVLLLSVQYIITWSSIRWQIIDRIVKSKPTIVLFNGELVEHNMKSVRVSEDEIHSAVRHQGIACLNRVHAVVLENNGTLSVIQHSDEIERSSLSSIEGYKQLLAKAEKQF